MLSCTWSTCSRYQETCTPNFHDFISRPRGSIYAANFFQL